MLAAFDVATSTGFALGGPNDGSPRCGTWKLPGTDETNFDRSLSMLHGNVLSLLKLIKATHVCIEAPLQMAGRSAHTALALVSLAAVVRAAAHRHGAHIRVVHVQTVRKHFLGVGRPEYPKEAVMDRCKLFGWSVADDNQGDAAAAWALGMSLSFPKWSPRSTPLFGRAAA